MLKSSAGLHELSSFKLWFVRDAEHDQQTFRLAHHLINWVHLSIWGDACIQVRFGHTLLGQWSKLRVEFCVQEAL